MNLSNNVRLDFLILLFARSILEVSKMDNSEETGVITIDHKNYKVDKRIDRRIEHIEKKLDDTIKEMYAIGGRKLAHWVSVTAKGRIDNSILALGGQKVNLEYLALNILFVNFCDYRKYAIMDKMQWIKEDENYIQDTLDLFSKTNVAFLEEESFINAADLIESVKLGRAPQINPLSLLGVKVPAQKIA